MTEVGCSWGGTRVYMLVYMLEYIVREGGAYRGRVGEHIGDGSGSI